jgi:hypothetical protein
MDDIARAPTDFFAAYDTTAALHPVAAAHRRFLSVRRACRRCTTAEDVGVTHLYTISARKGDGARHPGLPGDAVPLLKENYVEPPF